MKPKGIIYEHFTILQEHDKVSYKCKYCGKIYTCRNATRMASHISSCEKCPTMIKIVFDKKTTPGANSLNDTTQPASSSILKALQTWQANKQTDAERDKSNQGSQLVREPVSEVKTEIEVLLDPDPLSDSYEGPPIDDSTGGPDDAATASATKTERLDHGDKESSPANTRILEAILACMTRQAAAQEAQVRALDSLALAQKEQALAQKEQALAQKEQALAQKEQANAQLEQVRALDRIARLMEKQEKR